MRAADLVTWNIRRLLLHAVDANCMAGNHIKTICCKCRCKHTHTCCLKILCRYIIDPNFPGGHQKIQLSRLCTAGRSCRLGIATSTKRQDDSKQRYCCNHFFQSSLLSLLKKRGLPADSLSRQHVQLYPVKMLQKQLQVSLPLRLLEALLFRKQLFSHLYK